jgi:hypothetical protein
MTSNLMEIKLSLRVVYISIITPSVFKLLMQLTFSLYLIIHLIQNIHFNI